VIRRARGRCMDLRELLINITEEALVVRQPVVYKLSGW
jgi:hypothetical protein